MSAIFFALDHPFNFFSKAIAWSMYLNSSYKPIQSVFYCMYMTQRLHLFDAALLAVLNYLWHQHNSLNHCILKCKRSNGGFYAYSKITSFFEIIVFALSVLRYISRTSKYSAWQIIKTTYISKHSNHFHHLSHWVPRHSVVYRCFDTFFVPGIRLLKTVGQVRTQKMLCKISAFGQVLSMTKFKSRRQMVYEES